MTKAQKYPGSFLRALAGYACAVLSWDGVGFHHSLYGAVFLVFDQNSVDNTLMFWLLLNRACTAPRPPLFPTVPPQRAGRGWERGWRETRLGEQTKGPFITL